MINNCLVCGRPVSFTRLRLATHAHSIYVGIDALRIAEVAIGDELNGEPFLRVLREGQELLAAVHDWVHAFVGPSLNERRRAFSRMRHWRANARVFIRAWASYDRTSYQKHCSALRETEARLVRRITTGSVA
jgi:hypothetical protein